VLTSGETLTASKQIPVGDFSGNPIPSSVVVSKFHNLVDSILGSENTERLRSLVEAIDTLPNVRALSAIACATR
jgi:hypothetical protein